MYSLMARNKEVRNDRQMYAHHYAKAKNFKIQVIQKQMTFIINESVFVMNTREEPEI